MERAICIHGHFYQPPRDNPWLEAVEIEDSAQPYHDWNERVTAECYAPNSASRLLDAEGRIVAIVSNYEKISFNFGPTLLSWMEQHAPAVYEAVLAADALSRGARSGHGNALAQAYNHLILPLANPRDKRTQVRWGVVDFTHRFKRPPEGMWLPETAVDLETLEILAAEGIAFTILAPHQAARARTIGAATWEETAGGGIDPTRAYRCPLPSGRAISIFFFDASISRAIAFEGLLNKGGDFAARLRAGSPDDGDESRLLHVATDGETYGHHHTFGDMALADALHRLEGDGGSRLSNYGEHLERHPPLHEVQIHENTSWSCAHGVERWRGNCGCSTGLHANWNQEWRGPLRMALDWVRDQVAPLFEERARACLHDPWAARDDYVDVVLDRSGERFATFLGKHATRDLTDAEQVTVLELMELQRHALLMYTSCGWFFDELSGIETLQVLRYAGRVVQLAGKLFGRDLEPPFKELLASAKSNLPSSPDGAALYEKFVRPAMVDLTSVAAHYALSSLIREYGETARIDCYVVQREDYQGRQAGEARLAVGRVRVASDITREAEQVAFAVLHLGGHIFNGGLKGYAAGPYQPMKEEILSTFEKGSIADVVRLLDRHFGANNYSLKNLFRDEQRALLNAVIAQALGDFDHFYRLRYEKHRSLMVFLQEAGIPLPTVFSAAAEFTLLADAKLALSEEGIDVERVREVFAEMERWRVQPDAAALEFSVRKRTEALIDRLRSAPSDEALLATVVATLEHLAALPLGLNLWQAQNTLFSAMKSCCRDLPARAEAGDGAAARLADAYRRLGALLGFNPNALFP